MDAIDAKAAELVLHLSGIDSRSHLVSSDFGDPPKNADMPPQIWLASLPKPIAWRRVESANGSVLEVCRALGNRLQVAHRSAADQASGTHGFLSRLRHQFPNKTEAAIRVCVDVGSVSIETTLEVLDRYWRDYLWDEATGVTLLEAVSEDTPAILRFGRSKRTGLQRAPDDDT